MWRCTKIVAAAASLLAASACGKSEQASWPQGGLGGGCRLLTSTYDMCIEYYNDMTATDAKSACTTGWWYLPGHCSAKTCLEPIEGRCPATGLVLGDALVGSCTTATFVWYYYGGVDGAAGAARTSSMAQADCANDLGRWSAL